MPLGPPPPLPPFTHTMRAMRRQMKGVMMKEMETRMGKRMWALLRARGAQGVVKQLLLRVMLAKAAPAMTSVQ